MKLQVGVVEASARIASYKQVANEATGRSEWRDVSNYKILLAIFRCAQYITIYLFSARNIYNLATG